DGYAPAFSHRTTANLGRYPASHFVTYYVIKLQMQKQIPTLLQALPKQLYKVRLNVAMKVLLLLGLVGERAF
ncbi:MAG: hypothetical protein ACRC5D_13210, partial [Aeromonas allosaccharophila]